jgi:hypothetical protein
MSKSFSFGLIAAVSLFIAGSASSDIATFHSSYHWSPSTSSIRELSGLDVDKNGANFVSTSDKGHIFSGRFVRDNGKIVGIADEQSNPLKLVNGNPVARFNVDAEGVARASNGDLYVSYEGNHRIRRYTDQSASAQQVASDPAFKLLQNNSGFEAIAINAFDQIHVIPERSGAIERPYPVYRLSAGVWDSKLQFPRNAEFLPVGADFGPDAKLYVLERAFKWYRGFASQVRRFSVSQDKLVNEEIVLTTNYGVHGNLEGISVWLDADANLRVTMIADDNGLIFQGTEFVEYSIPSGG